MSRGIGSWRCALALGFVAGAAGGADAVAQDSAQIQSLIRDSAAKAVPAAAASDTLYPKSPTSPMGAFWRSLLIPGWGQAKLNRKLTGALFVTWEGVTLGMSIKANHELAYLRATKSGNVNAKAKERQDWLVLLAFNHLFSALEGYVSSHLWDFPEDLEFNAAPILGGGIGASLRIPFRIQ